MINYGIISINQSRKQNIDRIIDLLGSEPILIDGFNGKSKKDIDRFKDLYPKFDIDSYATQPVFPVSPNRREGEIGCWMSHYHLWNVIVDKNLEPTLIIEDDAYLDDDIIKFILSTNHGQDFMMFGNWAELNYMTVAGAKALIDLTPQFYRHFPIDEAMMNCVRLVGMREHNWPIPRCGKLPITRQLIETYKSDIG